MAQYYTSSDSVFEVFEHCLAKVVIKDAQNTDGERQNGNDEIFQLTLVRPRWPSTNMMHRRRKPKRSVPLKYRGSLKSRSYYNYSSSSTESERLRSKSKTKRSKLKPLTKENSRPGVDLIERHSSIRRSSMLPPETKVEPENLNSADVDEPQPSCSSAAEGVCCTPVYDTPRDLRAHQMRTRKPSDLKGAGPAEMAGDYAAPARTKELVKSGDICSLSEKFNYCIDGILQVVESLERETGGAYARKRAEVQNTLHHLIVTLSPFMDKKGFEPSKFEAKNIFADSKQLYEMSCQKKKKTVPPIDRNDMQQPKPVIEIKGTKHKRIAAVGQGLSTYSGSTENILDGPDDFDKSLQIVKLPPENWQKNDSEDSVTSQDSFARRHSHVIDHRFEPEGLNTFFVTPPIKQQEIIRHPSLRRQFLDESQSHYQVPKCLLPRSPGLNTSSRLSTVLGPTSFLFAERPYSILDNGPVQYFIKTDLDFTPQERSTDDEDENKKPNQSLLERVFNRLGGILCCGSLKASKEEDSNSPSVNVDACLQYDEYGGRQGRLFNKCHQFN